MSAFHICVKVEVLSTIKMKVMVFLTAEFGRWALTLHSNMQNTPTRMQTVHSLKMLVPPT
jgi:hypothetical protein